MNEYDPVQSFDRPPETPRFGDQPNPPALNRAGTVADALNPQVVERQHGEEGTWGRFVNALEFRDIEEGEELPHDELRFKTQYGDVEGHLDPTLIVGCEQASVVEYLDIAGAPKGDEKQLLWEFVRKSIAKGASRLVGEIPDPESLRVFAAVVGSENLSFFTADQSYDPSPLTGSYEEILQDLEVSTRGDEETDGLYGHMGLTDVLLVARLDTPSFLERLAAADAANKENASDQR